MKGFTGYNNVVGLGIASIILALQLFTVKCELTTNQFTNLRQHRQNSSWSSFTLEDGEQIALEVSYELLPPKELSEKLSSEIKLIKYKYRAVSKINHQRKWIPGELISTRITSEQIRLLNQSKEFGPLKDVSTIDLLPFYIVTALSFGKPYNPIVLSEMLSFQYGFSSSPNTVYYDGDDIYYDKSTSTYIFKKVPVEDCPPKRHYYNPKFKLDSEECPDKKHYWEFIVSDDGNVKLIKEYDIDSDGNKLFNLRYKNMISNY